MAVDQPVLYNNVWVYLRDSMGLSYGGANDKQKHNAEVFYNLLRVFGYSHQSACGILGNMQTESGLSPGALSGNLSALPNTGQHLADLDNNTLLAWNSNNSTGAHATGLIQWDGVGQNPTGNQIASFATRYDLQWYDWELQLFRLEMEYIYDPSGWGGVNGTTYNFWYPVSGTASITWANFKTFTGTVSDACDYFRLYRERSSDSATGIQHRRDNAIYWDSYFSGQSVTVKVSHTLNACMAYLFRDSGYTYSQYDCIHFVNLVRRRLGIPQMTNGTNSLWRNVGGNFLWWRGTVDDCISQYGAIPPGAYLFKCYPEGTPGYNTIPDQYRGDGVGNFDHIGIFTDRGKGVMQSGGYDDARQGVADTYYHPTQTNPQLAYNWWTHVAFGNNITFDGEPTPPQPPQPVFQPWMAFIFNRKKVLDNAIKSY